MGSVDRQARPRRPRRAPGFFTLYGSKARLAPWIIDNMPAHKGYVEPFCGSAQVLFAKPRVKLEVINDLDGGLVAALKAARERPEALAAVLALTPYSREEQVTARHEAKRERWPDQELIEAARIFLVTSQQGMCKAARASGWRAIRRHTAGDQHRWGVLPERVLEVAERLAGVIVEQRDACEVLAYYDHPDTLYYVDPPYHPGTCNNSGYAHRLDREGHARLAETLTALEGMVMLSGYPHRDYEKWFPGWPYLDCAIECPTAAAGGKDWKRTERLWFNPLAWERRAAAEERVA